MPSLSPSSCLLLFFMQIKLIVTFGFVLPRFASVVHILTLDPKLGANRESRKSGKAGAYLAFFPRYLQFSKSPLPPRHPWKDPHLLQVPWRGVGNVAFPSLFTFYLFCYLFTIFLLFLEIFKIRSDNKTRRFSGNRHSGVKQESVLLE